MRFLSTSLSARVSCNLFVLLAAISGLLLWVVDQADASAHPTDREVAAYGQAVGLPFSVANEQLAIQAQGTGIADQLKTSLANNYAGVWFDDKSGQFVIPVTDAGGETRARSLVQALGLNTSARLVSVDDTWAQLMTAHREIDSALSDLIRSGFVQTYLDPATNAIVIAVASDIPIDKSKTVTRNAEEAPVDVRVEKVEVSHFEATPDACWIAGRVCDRPPRAGIMIENSGGGGVSCTGAFKGIGNTYGNRFVLTAGHCVTEYADWRSFDSGGVGHYLGHVEGASFPGDDYAAIRVNGYGNWWEEGPTWTPTVVYWGGNQNLPISSESSSYLNEAICHSGSNTGSSCGVVRKVDLTVSYPRGSVHHLTEAAGEQYLQGPGDSGGPIWSGETAVGMLSGGINGEPHLGFYSEVTRATAALGVSVGTPVGAPPFAETLAASGIEGRTAVANGKVDPNGVSTSYRFEYGPTTAYGSSTTSWSAGSGFDTISVGQSIAGLVPERTYHYRIVATSSAGTCYGEDRVFNTPQASPLVTAQAPTSRTSSSATLQGTIEPGGPFTTYQFEWGATTAYGTKTSVSNSSGSGTTYPISAGISGLAPEASFHFRVAASNSVGAVVSEDRVFTALANTPSFLSSFGSAGSGSGQFNRPMGAAVDSGGNVYVVDRENNRVSKFNAKGEFLSQFGSSGSGNGQFKEPRSIAVSPNGHLWVTDAGNARVEEFTAAGEYIQQLGGGKLSTPYGIAVDGEGRVWVSDVNKIVEFKESSPGSFPFYGELTSIEGSAINQPGGLGLDSQGDVWVAEVGANRISEIEGTASGYVGRLRFGTAGSGQGQLSQPYDVKVKASGNLVVVDRGNNRVQQFSPSGEFQATFGTKGSASGQFTEPSGVALGQGGLLFVTDSGNKRVQRWSQAQKPEALTQPATSIGKTSATLNGFVNPSSLATTYKFEYGQTTGYGTSVPVPSGSVGSGVERVAESQTISVQPETTYHYRIVGTNSEGTTYGGDIQFTTPANTPSFLSSFGSAGSGSGQFNRPMGAAVDSGGNVYVVDRENNRVSKFNAKGEFLSQFGSSGSGNGQFKEPRSIAVSPNGHLWVTDAGNARVEEFTAAGEYIQQLGGGKLSTPYGIAVDGEGRVWVSDVNKIVEFKESSPGSFPFYGELTSIEGSAINQPGGLGLDSQGDVWVAEVGANRISEIEGTASGYVGRLRFGTAGSGQGQLSQPYDVKVKASGNLVVVDRGNNRVQQFSPSGEFQATFGTKGSASGQFTEPSGVALGQGGLLFVTDSGNKRVQRWSSE
jgi:DNA-binding beta-propeller fold protein YncE